MSAERSLEALRRALPADTERATHGFAIDGREPRIVFSPDEAAEVAELLRAANAEGLSVVPQGGRTALALGRPLARYDVALETRGLDRVVEYVPDDLTVTVESGMHLDVLQEVLAEHGQYLPVDPPPDDHVTIGGLLATARSGAWRGHLPAARDLVLGCTVALPGGTLVASGGRVVKNVTGYDMHRLHTGALGAFGVIVEASFKVAARPAVTRTLAAHTSHASQAAELGRRLWHSSIAARAITVLSAAAASRAGLRERPGVLVELAGAAASVERSAVTVSGLAGRVEEAPREAWARLRRLAGDAAGMVLRLGAPPTRIGEALAAAEAIDAVAWAHVAAGSVLAYAGTLDAAAVGRLRAQAVSWQGFVQIEAAPAALRTQVDPLGGGDAALMRALRDQFDPGRTINPGRWGEGL